MTGRDLLRQYARHIRDRSEMLEILTQPGVDISFLPMREGGQGMERFFEPVEREGSV